MILFKIFAFIWKTIFNKTRVIYIFLVRLIMTYIFSVWHMLKIKKTSIDDKLTVLQNKCLRTISNVFRIILVSMFEIETHIVSINTHLNQLQVTTCLRLRIDLAARYIIDSCKAIAYKLRSRIDRRRIKHRVISDELKSAWAKNQLTIIIVSSSKNVSSASWSNLFRISSNRDKFIKQRRREIKKFHDKQWKDSWTIYLSIVLDLSSTQTKFIDKERLKLHEQLRKVKSSLTTQIRTKKINFADFLHRRKMLKIDLSTCQCEWNKQIAKHVIMFCLMMSDKDILRRDVEHFDYNQMMHSDKSLKIIVKWLIKHDLFTQYALASKLLYFDWFSIYIILFYSFFFSCQELHRVYRRCDEFSNTIRTRFVSHDFSLDWVFHVIKSRLSPHGPAFGWCHIEVWIYLSIYLFELFISTIHSHVYFSLSSRLLYYMFTSTLLYLLYHIKTLSSHHDMYKTHSQKIDQKNSQKLSIAANWYENCCKDSFNK